MLSFIPDIAEEHFEELQFLWTQRTNALRSAAYTMREMGMLEERIEAHTQGLLVLGDDLLEFVGNALDGDDPVPAFAAAYALLRLGTAGAIERVRDAFIGAEGKRLEALGEALAHGPSQPLIPLLQSLFTSAPPPLAVVAGNALAFQRSLHVVPDQLVPLLYDELPAVRQGAWRIVTNGAIAVAPQLYDAGMNDENPDVQRAALVAAAWNGYRGWLSHCYRFAKQPSPDSVELLAMLAAVLPPQEYKAVMAFASTVAFGPARYRIAAAFGHPVMVDFLLGEMDNVDPAVAAGAGAAFSKMLGVAIASDKRVTLRPPEGSPPPDEFEAEFLDEVQLPDVPKARQHWERVKPQLAHASRIAHGVDVSAGVTRETFGLLDMESRRELSLRARLTGGWQGTPVMLEQFPQSEASR
jgi:uncharacterized protein (TIGR02270 family)